LSKRPSRFTTSRYSASVLEHDGSDEERDHSNETVDEVHELALVNSCETSLPVVNLTDALSNTLVRFTSSCSSTLALLATSLQWIASIRASLAVASQGWF